MWQFRFAKIAVNVAHPPGVQHNQLPDLLRRWFGPRAGEPGTDFQVHFAASPDGLWIEPVGGRVLVLPVRRGIIAYPELHAAAGHAQGAAEPPDPDRVVMLPLDRDRDDPDLFAVRVAGDSMDGGKTPMRDGDWAVMRVARGAPASALEGRVVLVQLPAEPTGNTFQIKRLERARPHVGSQRADADSQRVGAAWQLVSDNPDGPTFDGAPGMVPIARLEQVVRPEDLAPPAGTVLDEADLAAAFGLDELAPDPAAERWGGHLFLFIADKHQLRAPDRIVMSATDARIAPRPGETAFALAKRRDGSWRYLGVARQIEGESAWRISDVDYETWRTWGEGRDVSRPLRALPEGALSRAQLVADAILALPDADRWIEQPGGRRARVIGAAPRGGLRIDGGGEGGFALRTVSLTDIAWVVAADADVRDNGGLLDEARVNHLRYLEGTPRGSTRWIDTGWALAAWHAGKDRVREPVVARVHRDTGEEIDATFRVERIGDAQSVVIESRGGTRGSSAERNTDYAEGLELILARLGSLGLSVAESRVESRETDQLSAEDRRLDLGAPYPIAIAAGDAPELRKRMSAAMARIGRKPGAKGGGNQNKRVRIVIAGDAPAERELANALAKGK